MTLISIVLLRMKHLTILKIERWTGKMNEKEIKNEHDLVELFYHYRNLYHSKLDDREDMADNIKTAIIRNLVIRIRDHYGLNNKDAVSKTAKFIKKLFQYEDELNKLHYGILSISVLNGQWIVDKLIEISSGRYKRRYKKKRTNSEVKRDCIVAQYEAVYDNEPAESFFADGEYND